MRGVGQNLLLGRRSHSDLGVEDNTQRLLSAAHRRLMQDYDSEEQFIARAIKWLQLASSAREDRREEGLTRIEFEMPAADDNYTPEMEQMCFLYMKALPYHEREERAGATSAPEVVIDPLLDEVNSELTTSLYVMLQTTAVHLGWDLRLVESTKSASLTEHIVRDATTNKTYCGWVPKQGCYIQTAVSSVEGRRDLCARCVKARPEGEGVYQRVGVLNWFNLAGDEEETEAWNWALSEDLHSQIDEVENSSDLKITTDVGEVLAKAVIGRQKVCEKKGCEILNEEAFTRSVSEWVKGGRQDASEINKWVRSLDI